jgi:adenylosuccinate synthase
MCSAGIEYGTTTGRKRRCGWIDIVQLRHALYINGVTRYVHRGVDLQAARGRFDRNDILIFSIFLTKLDVLDNMPMIKMAVGYKHKGELITNFPCKTAHKSSN